MRKILVLVLFLFAEKTLTAQTSYLWVEPQINLERSSTSGRTTTGENFTTVSFGKQWSRWKGISVQTSHGNFWGETIVGPSFSLTENISISPAIGVEHYAPNPIRFRLDGAYDHSSGSFFYVSYDVGKTDSWVWIDGTKFFGPIGLGGIMQMPGGGAGPKIELRKGKFAVWVAPVREWQEKTTRVLVGTRLMFDW